jgi:hypothetical protein
VTAGMFIRLLTSLLSLFLLCYFCPFEVQSLLLKSSWTLKRLQKVFCNLSCEANDSKEERV